MCNLAMREGGCSQQQHLQCSSTRSALDRNPNQVTSMTGKCDQVHVSTPDAAQTAYRAMQTRAIS